MIKELHNRLINGEETSVGMTEGFLARIKERNEKINAFITVTKKLALEQAQMTDEKIKSGKAVDVLAGIPCAIKDNMNIFGVRSTAASKILENYEASYDATVVKKLKEADAVFLGKTNLDEFACGSSTETSAYSVTKNPLDEERVPGGSSGGSAAAVADDQCVWALGSDTGGSIRHPAAFCGVVGLKPTYGRVSRYGLLAMASSLDQIGPIAKTVEDSAIIFSRVYGEDPMDSTTAPDFGKKFEDYLAMPDKKIVIGLPKECFGEGLDERVKNEILKAAEVFKSLGCEIKEVALKNMSYALPAYYLIMSSELSSNLARFDGIKYGASKADAGNLLEVYLKTRGANFGAEIKRRIMLGTYALSAGYYDAYYKKAQKVRALVKNDFEKAFSEVDLLLTPTTPGLPFKIGEKTEDPLAMYLEDIYTVTANVAGLPAITIPAGEVEENGPPRLGEAGRKFPVGVQLMGKWYDEETMLAAAHNFQINK